MPSPLACVGRGSAALRSAHEVPAWEKQAQGITIVHLYGRDLATLALRIPTVPEQTAIATILSDMDAEIAELEVRRDKTRALKQGMMQQLLTGSIRLA